MGDTSLAWSLDTLSSAQARNGGAEAAELDRAIELIVAFSANSYSRHSDAYSTARGLQTTEWEEALNDTLLSTVRGQIAGHRAPAPRGPRWRLLDVGAGSGRDLLRLAREADVEPIALDNAPGIVDRLRQLAATHGLPAESVVEGEMRDLSTFPSATFHCVRNHASLHHLPLVSPGRGADLAIAESRRILVAGGVLYVLVRAGEGLTMIDTGEGLGPRVFQLFSPETMDGLLQRHGFRTLRMEPVVSKRGRQDIHWLFCFAEAV